MGSLPILAGLVMGAASSLHCLGMCGPIACGLVLGTPSGTGTAERAGLLMAAQVGKALSYGLMGGLFGVFGAGLYGVLNLELGHAILQWTAGLSLVWVGLSLAGLVPAMAGFDRLLAPLAGRLSALRGRGVVTHWTDGVLFGLIWGLMPCAMVYVALFNALLAGSVLDGALVMVGFGLGTMPMVTLGGMGLYGLMRSARSEKTRLIAGLALAAAGAISVLLTAPGSPFCIWR